jgi:hypothetical protein
MGHSLMLHVKLDQTSTLVMGRTLRSWVAARQTRVLRGAPKTTLLQPSWEQMRKRSRMVP